MMTKSNVFGLGWAVCCFFALSMASARAEAPANLTRPVSLETRWWNEHEFAWRLAEAAGLRWTIVDGISGRARAGGLDQPAAAIAAQFTEETGIAIELINGILVAHRPNETRRKELEADLRKGGETAVRAAWLLGWLKDARAWPALAQAAAGKDVALALSAAVALRRLDGEEDFDIRRWIPLGAERQGDLFYGKKSPLDAGLSQVPLGACFEKPVTLAEARTMAQSAYVPLREAAARISAGLAEGKALAEQLGADPSLYARQAAARALRTWETPGAYPNRPILAPDLTKFRAGFADAKAKPERNASTWLAAFGTDDDMRLMIARGGISEGLIHNAGGQDLANAMRENIAQGRPRPYSAAMSRFQSAKYILAKLMDGERLAEALGPHLGTEHWSLSSELLVARLAGPPALPHFTKEVFAQRGHVAPTAAGFIGGPDGVAAIAPLLAEGDLKTAVAAARGLGESGQQSAIAPLISALSHPNRIVRSRAALGLGRIGGPDAAQALADLIGRETEYLPKRSATLMLEEVRSGEPAHAQIVARSRKELDAFVPAYNPVNPRFGNDFPEGDLVEIERLFTVVGIGEIRCAIDSNAGVWTYYGGCSGGYNNQFQGYDVASGEWFTIRPPEMTSLFYNETRAGGGCSRGMTFDPRSRRFWINNATRAPRGTHFYNWAMVFSSGSCSYDLATDRFEGPFPEPDGKQGTYYVADTTRGHIYSEVMSGGRDRITQVIDGSNGQLKDLKFEGLPSGLGAFYVHEAAGYDPVSKTVFREIRPHKFKRRSQPEEEFGMWMLNTETMTARKTAQPPGNKVGSGTQMLFDSLNREIMLFRTEGAHVYDRENDGWRKVADGDKWFYVYDFDPRHNVFLGSGGTHNMRLMAFRLKNVPEGTKAFFGQER